MVNHGKDKTGSYYKANGRSTKKYYYKPKVSKSAVAAFRRASKQHEAILISIFSKKKSKKK